MESRSLPRLTTSRFVAATPTAAWELITSTGSWAEWGPTVSAVEPADARVSLGMRGRVRTPVGVWLPFRITTYDPPHAWAWDVLGVPATSHTVEEAPGGCRIGLGLPVPALAYLLVCRVALGRIAGLLETRKD